MEGRKDNSIYVEPHDLYIKKGGFDIDFKPANMGITYSTSHQLPCFRLGAGRFHEVSAFVLTQHYRAEGNSFFRGFLCYHDLQGNVLPPSPKERGELRNGKAWEQKASRGSQGAY